MKPGRYISILLLLVTLVFRAGVCTGNTSPAPDTLCLQVDRFGLDSATTKLVDNQGMGNDSLWGVRNFRVVLRNLLYRGGGNNLSRKASERRHYFKNPLPMTGIENLHRAGVTKAIYLYSRNFGTYYPGPVIDSLAAAGFEYSVRPEISDSMLLDFFGEIRDRISHPGKGMIYIHCWNGWHQSGLLSALTLMQFCGLNNMQALEYWETCTDGLSRGYRPVRERIRSFVPFQDIRISDEEKQARCPCFSQTILNPPPDTLKEAHQKTRMKYHRVVKGDTLQKIARSHNIPLSRLMRLNGLKSDDIIYPGQKIRIAP